jgi:hypothetical protein
MPLHHFGEEKLIQHFQPMYRFRLADIRAELKG